jgi:hypothetical protein
LRISPVVLGIKESFKVETVVHVYSSERESHDQAAARGLHPLSWS